MTKRDDIPLRDRAGNPIEEKPGGGITMSAYEEVVPKPSDWGPWSLHLSNLTLVGPPPFDYPVDLEDCKTAARTLDWIAQVAQKTWADDSAIAGLVRALDDLLNMQGSLCPSGQPAKKPLTAERIREKAHATAAERYEGFEVYPELR